ncbi:hypothetical protein C0J52_13695 [Blattella germanica]|nr:hypothetical protein C0J52_13695 [Blattella germanica]
MPRFSNKVYKRKRPLVGNTVLFSGSYYTNYITSNFTRLQDNCECKYYVWSACIFTRRRAESQVHTKIQVGQNYVSV